MNESQIAKMYELMESLPDCPEKVVLCTMLGNLYSIQSNQPIADFCRNIALSNLLQAVSQKRSAN